MAVYDVEDYDGDGAEFGRRDRPATPLNFYDELSTKRKRERRQRYSRIMLEADRAKRQRDQGPGRYGR